MNGREVKELSQAQRMERVPIGQLVPYARNARTHGDEQVMQVRASLREFGFVNPVLVDKDYNIIAGHCRVMAAKAEGIAEVPYVQQFQDLRRLYYINFI